MFWPSKEKVYSPGNSGCDVEGREETVGAQGSSRVFRLCSTNMSRCHGKVVARSLLSIRTIEAPNQANKTETLQAFLCARRNIMDPARLSQGANATPVAEQEERDHCPRTYQTLSTLAFGTHEYCEENDIMTDRKRLSRYLLSKFDAGPMFSQSGSRLKRDGRDCVPRSLLPIQVDSAPVQI